MGRKTWESIPSKFRPLKDRTNVVISRSTGKYSQNNSDKEAYFESPSLEATIHGLDSLNSKVEKTFVIGGGQIYKAALDLKETKRILLTRVLDDFECDTFFPVQLNDDGQGEKGWFRRDKADLDTWVGENVPEGVQTEGEKNTRYIFEMWERDTS